MRNSVEQFEEVYNLFAEVTSPTPPASGAIAATDSPPRKDFGPAAGNGYPPSLNRKGLADPYQSHPEIDMAGPPRPAHLPYPLDTVATFLGDSAVYLDAACNQIKAAIKTYELQRDHDPIAQQKLKELFKHGKQALKHIDYIGKNIEKIANMNY